MPNEYGSVVCHCERNGLSKSETTVIEADSVEVRLIYSSAAAISEMEMCISGYGYRQAQGVLRATFMRLYVSRRVPPKQALHGGTKVLIVGGWYLRGHNYTAMFAGGRSPALAELAQRLSFVHSCLLTEGVDCVRELPETDAETVVLETCNEMMKYPLNYSLLATPPPDHNGNSLLHLCAWRSEISSRFYLRDFDVVARDSEGRTPLHLAISHANLFSIQALISHCPSAIDVLDDRGETPQDLMLKSQNPHIACTVAQSVEAVRQRNAKVNEERSPLTKESVNSTALWVMTNGETVTDEQRLAYGSSLTSSCLVQTQDRCSQNKSINQSSDLSDVDSPHQNGSSQSSDDSRHVRIESACISEGCMIDFRTVDLVDSMFDDWSKFLGGDMRINCVLSERNLRELKKKNSKNTKIKKLDSKIRTLLWKLTKEEKSEAANSKPLLREWILGQQIGIQKTIHRTCFKQIGCSSDCHMSSEGSSWMEGPLSMDVHIPDSPTIAGMWNALERFF
uniref:Uncharacterized protein n=1 Tax=Parascaris equorum TaxID=6256 RepID=A0A914RSH6_PAREQ